LLFAFAFDLAFVLILTLAITQGEGQHQHRDVCLFISIGTYSFSCVQRAKPAAWGYSYSAIILSLQGLQM
jgi:hypothetical protein